MNIIAKNYLMNRHNSNLHTQTNEDSGNPLKQNAKNKFYLSISLITQDNLF